MYRIETWNGRILKTRSTVNLTISEKTYDIKDVTSWNERDGTVGDFRNDENTAYFSDNFIGDFDAGVNDSSLVEIHFVDLPRTYYENR